jgi:molybdopterin converting factor small subunit
MPNVNVKLFAMLQKYLPAGKRQAKVEVAEGATVAEALARLGVPAGSVHLIRVNGEQAEPGTVLHDGDSVSVFPPVAGG